LITQIAQAETHTRRPGRLYRYQIWLGASRRDHDTCPVRSIAASEVEDLVLSQVRRLLASPELVARTITAVQRENGAAEDIELEEGDVIEALGALEPVWDELYPAEQARIVRLLIERIDVARRHLRHAARCGDSQPRRGAGGPGGSRSGRVRTLAGGRRVMTGRAALELDTLTIRIPVRLQRRGGRKLIMTPERVAAPGRKPNRDETLVKALVRAHRWRRRIESGRAKSITDLAEQEGVTDAYVCRLVPLTCLAPDIVEAILDGRQPKGLRLAEMLGNAPVSWEEQRRAFGFRQSA
jgi:hypothetical protein